MTLAELKSYVISSLAPSLGEGEARATARLLLEDDLGADNTTVVIHGDRVLEPETEQRFKRYVEQINAGMPPQYAVGKARFMGMTFEVTPDTLIPRPETAELVDIITDHYKGESDLHACDLGTGSGCIAIALARALPFLNIMAVDISDGAVAVARRNADSLKAKVNFEKGDILGKMPTKFAPYDFIVSNPPYIAESEKMSMESGVKDYEPATALFVPDNDPLEFYRAILKFGADNLKPDGVVFFEINPLFVAELSDLCDREGYTCSITRDSFGKDRFAVCNKK